MNETKDEYGANRQAGLRGQGFHPSVIIGYTPAEKVVQGAYSTRKARRAVEIHLTSLEHRRAQ